MASPTLSFDRVPEGTLVARLGGPWHLQRDMPSVARVAREIESGRPGRLAFDTATLTAWDSSLLTFLIDVGEFCVQHHVTVDRNGLPKGVQRLLALAEAVPERQGARQGSIAPPWLARVGDAVLRARDPLREMFAFIGSITLALGRLARGRARFRVPDLLLLVQQAGAQALGIVTLISFLVGLILAFVGAVQLEQFGAAIYVANLVGIALCLMMPLLCLYADAIGILGGAAVGMGMLNIPMRVYYDQTISAVHVVDLVGGIFKASVYGVLIAIAGCLRGMQCGNSSSAVGDAATRAVVTGIVFIISACGIFAVMFYVLGI